jgi:hypothetical protein
VKLAALGSMLAYAHELNNPLSIVIGHALMLGDEISDHATAADFTKPGPRRKIQAAADAAAASSAPSLDGARARSARRCSRRPDRGRRGAVSVRPAHQQHRDRVEIHQLPGLQG